MAFPIRSRWLILVLILVCSARVRGDSVTLTTGEKITGTIKSETDTEIVIEVPVSASITDERIFRKQDVAKVDKEQPDEIAFRQIAQLQPNGQYSYSSQTYDQILAMLDSFEATYPKSNHLADVQRLRDDFQVEKRHVDAGQYKYLGEWLSKEEANRRRIQIVAMQVFGNMQQQAAGGDLVGAMQTFAAIEQNYNTTRVYPASVVLAQQILIRLQQQLASRMEAIKADEVQLKSTIAFTAEPEKSRIIAQAKAEDDRAASIIAASVQSGMKWVPLIPRSQVSVDTLQKTAASESSRLASITVGSMNASTAKVDAARNAINQGDFSTADSLLKDASTLWSQNEDAHYWSEHLKEKMAPPTPKPAASATAKPLPTVHATPQAHVAAAAAPAVEEEKPFYMTPTGIIPILAGVLIAVGLVGSYMKKKASKQQVAE